ncbi:hypothetical protein Tco_0669420 [Tanacetum coccineum]
MKRGFRGVPRPLLPAMLHVVAQNAGQADQARTQSQPSSSIVPPPPTFQPAPTESTTILPTPVTEPTSKPSSPSTTPEHEIMEHPFEQPSPEHQPSSPREESDILQTQAPTHTHEAEIGHMSVDDLFQWVPQLITRIESLEKDLKQTKQTMGNAIVKLVKKVKKMEKNPKQGKSSGETDISPQGLEAAETLAEALSQIKTKRRNVKTGVKRRLDAEDVSTGFEDVSTSFKDVSTGFEDVSTSFEDISTGFTDIKSASEKLVLVVNMLVLIKEKERRYLKKLLRPKEQRNKSEKSRLDALTAKRLQEELQLSKAQKKRMAQVMVGLISQRRKLIAEQKAKAQRDKPMTQAQQRQYMATYLKNQGGWKLAQIKKLTDEELKEKFEYLMRSMERFVPMDTEKESRKRTGVELQTESSKKLKSDTREDVSVPKEKDKESVKREEEFEIKKPVLRYTKRKSLARKGLQKKPESAKSGTEEDVEAYMEERVDEPSSEEFPMSSIPQGPAPAKIVKWQIIKTGKRGAYQIIREDNTDVVYVNFPGLLNDLTRDDLKELYRLMMLKYGDNRPEEEFERVLWGDLKTMFDPPSEEDAIWKLPHQQQILNWRYFHSCSVHCLTVEAAHIYMLTEVKYPLPPRVCKAMLEKKLLGDRKDESTMSNRHKDWLVQEQTALGKDFSNPFMADNLPKIVWLSTHHIYVCKELASPQGYGLCQCCCLFVAEKIIHVAVKCWPCCLKDLMLQISLVMISRVADRSQEPVYTGKSSCCSSRIIPNIMLTKSSGSYNEDIERNLKFTSEDIVRGGLLGIIVNRLKSASTKLSLAVL